MFITILFWVFACALILKLIGNFLLPYRVLQMEEDKSISLGFSLLGDWILFLIVVGLAFSISDSGYIYDAENAALIAGGSIALSYLHYFGILSLVSLWRKFKR